MDFIEKNHDPNEKITVKKLITFLNSMATFSKMQVERGYQINNMEYVVRGAVASKTIFDLLEKIPDIFDNDQMSLEYTYEDLEKLMGLIFADANLKFDFANEVHPFQGASIIYDDLMSGEETEFMFSFIMDDDDEEDEESNGDDTDFSDDTEIPPNVS